jgi:hypothetical protein
MVRVVHALVHGSNFNPPRMTLSQQKSPAKRGFFEWSQPGSNR